MEKQIEGLEAKRVGEEEEILDLLAEFATAIEAALQLKEEIARIVKVPMGTISEELFLNLRWEKSQGARLKEYEFTTKVANDGNDSFYHCLNILKANKASINNRFHCEGWKYSYWLYVEKPDVIFRQLLKPKGENTQNKNS